MSTMFFSTKALAEVLVYLDASVEDVLAFSRANAKAFNGLYKKCDDQVQPPSEVDLVAFADQIASDLSRPSTKEAHTLLENVSLFRYNTDDFQNECSEALTRIEAKAFRMWRGLELAGTEGIGDDYREKRGLL